MPLLFVYMMSRGGAKGPLDFSTLFKRPALAFGWLFLGTSILQAYRIHYAAQLR